MWTKLYWIEGPWPGKLAVAARPRGGDWLEDEVLSWHQAGVRTVVSLLTRDEERGLELTDEARLVRAQGIRFVSLPIPDRQVPASQGDLLVALEQINADLSAGKNTLIHCRQGIGRSGLVSACLLVAKGWEASRAIDHISAARGVTIPETTEQRRFIDQYAASLAGTKA